MCTVSFLPSGNQGFFLTSNRDEDIKRSIALPVSKYQHNGIDLYYPKDPKAGGTWIATGTNGFTLCLFNGAFNKHTPKGNYKKSRGLVLLDFFNYQNQYEFIDQYDFKGIEPFSLIFVKHQLNKVGLCELKWDGELTYHINHDASLPHIWSSVTLYNKDVIKQREDWFNQWVKENPVVTKDSILMFHHFGGNGDKENDLVMKRRNKKTVSICCIHKRNETETEITYEDVLKKKIQTDKILSL
jgi:hypothetical protein